MAELNETATAENKMDWVDDGIPELQENPVESEVVELVTPRVKVEVWRYDELISKEALLGAITRCIFAGDYLPREMISHILGEFAPDLQALPEPDLSENLRELFGKSEKIVNEGESNEQC